MPLLHSHASAIASQLRKEGITALYHFTPIKNLQGISKRQALCSKKLLAELGDWPVPEPGGNTLSHVLDGGGGNLDMVNLNFSPHTPMAYNAKSATHLCFFEILTAVACWEGVMFTDTNAARRRNGVKKGKGLDGLALVNFGMIRSRPQPGNRDWHRLSQAEVLAPEKIPMEFVSKVVFVSEASRNEGQRLWSTNTRPTFDISTIPFASYPESPNEVGFSYVTDVRLTDSSDNSAAVTTTPRFEKSPLGRVTAIIYFNALAGTKITVRFDPPGNVQEAEVGIAGLYKWEPYVAMDDLRLGFCSCEVKLSNILWSVKMFEMI